MSGVTGWLGRPPVTVTADGSIDTAVTSRDVIAVLASGVGAQVRSSVQVYGATDLLELMTFHCVSLSLLTC